MDDWGDGCGNRFVGKTMESHPSSQNPIRQTVRAASQENLFSSHNPLSVHGRMANQQVSGGYRQKVVIVNILSGPVTVNQKVALGAEVPDDGPEC